jgi:di/tricarboxylate transporter
VLLLLSVIDRTPCFHAQNAHQMLLQADMANSLKCAVLCLPRGCCAGAVVPDAWTTWFIGCLPPAILGMVVTPILLFKLFPPEVRDASAALQDDAAFC